MVTRNQVQTAQVSCIKKADRFSTHEGITYIGGAGWRLTRQDAITAIENKTYAFFTNVGGKVAWVGVNSGPNGKYLHTHADGVWTNNLLALPECW